MSSSPTSPRAKRAGSRKQRREHVLRVRCSQAELAAIQQRATAAGLSSSELVRRAVRRTRAWTAPDRERLDALTRAVARIGTNLNQIAHRVNRDHSEVDARWLMRGLAAVHRELARITPPHTTTPEDRSNDNVL